MTLPEPLVEPNVRQFPSSRKRAMTGREAAEQEERDKARRRRRAAVQAQDEHDENYFWSSQMVTETQLRHSQRETQPVLETQLSALSCLHRHHHQKTALPTPSLVGLDVSSNQPAMLHRKHRKTGQQQHLWRR